MWSNFLINEYFSIGDIIIVNVNSYTIIGKLYKINEDTIILINESDNREILKTIIMYDDIEFVSQKTNILNVDELFKENGIKNIILEDYEQQNDEDDIIDDFPVPPIG